MITNPKCIRSCEVIIHLEDGTILTGNLGPEDDFMADLQNAINEGKDPFNALAYLADEGSQKGDRKSFGWINRVSSE